MARVARVALLLRRPPQRPRTACALYDALQTALAATDHSAAAPWASSSDSAGELERATRVVYVANRADREHGDGGDTVNLLPDSLSLERALAGARVSDMTRILMVHGRDTLKLVQQQLGAAATPLFGRVHLLHVFVDPELVLENATTDPAFTEELAARVLDWTLLDDREAGGTRLKPGTFVNATNLSGRVVAGVMTGGTKDPLGAMV